MTRSGAVLGGYKNRQEKPLRWRSPERVAERCWRMKEMQKEGLPEKAIALAIFNEFGNPKTGKPMDPSSVQHHLSGKCTHTVSATEATESPGPTS